MGIREVSLQIVDWIRLNQDGDRWGALVNKIMNLLFL
jgi:hypothetical protein